MRLYETLCAQRNTFLPRYGANRARKNGRNPLIEEQAKFTELFPLKLRDEVTQSRKDSELACVKEVLQLIDCLKLNEWNQSSCEKEANASHRCRQNYLTSLAISKKNKDKVDVPPYARQLNHRQMNVLLQKYPQNTK